MRANEQGIRACSERAVLATDLFASDPNAAAQSARGQRVSSNLTAQGWHERSRRSSPTLPARKNRSPTPPTPSATKNTLTDMVLNRGGLAGSGRRQILALQTSLQRSLQTTALLPS